MTTYRAAVGSNVALGSLTVLLPQPRSPGVQAARRTVMADGSIVDEGLYVELHWNVLGSAALVAGVFTPLGLYSAKSAAVTIYARHDLYGWTRYNGRAIRPMPSWDNYFPRNITVIVRGLQVAT